MLPLLPILMFSMERVFLLKNVDHEQVNLELQTRDLSIGAVLMPIVDEVAPKVVREVNLAFPKMPDVVDSKVEEVVRVVM